MLRASYNLIEQLVPAYASVRARVALKGHRRERLIYASVRARVALQGHRRERLIYASVRAHVAFQGHRSERLIYESVTKSQRTLGFMLGSDEIDRTCNSVRYAMNALLIPAVV
jgi:hypothetical protein